MIYGFEDCELDMQRHELRRAGAPCAIEPQAFKVLIYLLENRDRVIRKDELLERLWPGQHVSEGTLSQRLMLARKAVGDSGREQRIIKTVHGMGYRFVAEVAANDGAAPFRDAALAPPSPAPSAPEPERKVVTVLCAVLDAGADGSGIDALPALMQAAYDLINNEAQRYEGALQPLAGTSLLALFGAPLTQEDHARRATLAALGAQTRLQRDPPLLQWPSGAPVKLRLALHTAAVAFGSFGDDASQTPTVVGEATTLAMALAQQAAPGEILLSEATRALVARDMLTTPLQQVNTYAGSMGVAQLLGRAPQDVTSGRPEGLFVGRGADLATLQERLSIVMRGQGQVVGVMGNAGMGKSRLVLAFRQSLDASTLTYVQGRCQSYGRAMPYLPLQDMLRAAWVLSAAGAEARDRLLESGPELDRWEPYFSTLLGRDIDAEPALASLRPEALREQTFEALRQWLFALSRRQPLVVAIEDVHWIDPTSEAFLTDFVERLVGAPILLIVTFRPGHRPAWMDKSYATHLTLQPLGPEASQHVVRAASGSAPLSAEREQQIVRQAAGNPFFLVELAAAATSGDAAATMPDTIQAVLLSRMDRLPPPAKQLLQLASVCGVTAPLALLQAVAAWPEASFREALADLRAAEMLYETQPAPEPAYAFQHALTQEAAYQSLLLPTRRRMHRQAAKVLSDRGAGTARPAWLAHHYTQAGSGAQAIPCWLQAARRAIRGAAHAEAREHLRQGQAMLQTLPSTPERAEQELTLQLLLGAASGRRPRSIPL